MDCAGVLCLLLAGIMPLVCTETYTQGAKEKNIAVLKCGKLSEGRVTWSRDVNGKRVDILTVHNGQTSKHIDDPQNRYQSGKNPVLIIHKVSHSDAGMYWCNNTAVELRVSSAGDNFETDVDGKIANLPKNGNCCYVMLRLVFAVVTGSFLIMVVSVLIIWRHFHKINGQRKIELLYSNVKKPKKSRITQ